MDLKIALRITKKNYILPVLLWKTETGVYRQESLTRQFLTPQCCNFRRLINFIEASYAAQLCYSFTFCLILNRSQTSYLIGPLSQHVRIYITSNAPISETRPQFAKNQDFFVVKSISEGRTPPSEAFSQLHASTQDASNELHFLKETMDVPVHL